MTLMEKGCGCVLAMMLLVGCTDHTGRTAAGVSASATDAQSSVGAETASDVPTEGAQATEQQVAMDGAGSGNTVADEPVAKDGDVPAAQADGGNEDADVDLAIDNLLGDHETYRGVFDRLQQGILSNDKVAVASLVNYPLEVQIDGKKHKVRNANEFVSSWDRIVTPEIVEVVSKQRYRDLFVNWQGVMLGDGQVWINGICRDNACKKVDVGVVTFQKAVQ